MCRPGPLWTEHLTQGPRSLLTAGRLLDWHSTPSRGGLGSVGPSHQSLGSCQALAPLAQATAVTPAAHLLSPSHGPRQQPTAPGTLAWASGEPEELSLPSGSHTWGGGEMPIYRWASPAPEVYQGGSQVSAWPGLRCVTAGAAWVAEHQDHTRHRATRGLLAPPTPRWVILDVGAPAFLIKTVQEWAAQTWR